MRDLQETIDNTGDSCYNVVTVVNGLGRVPQVNKEKPRRAKLCQATPVQGMNSVQKQKAVKQRETIPNTPPSPDDLAFDVSQIYRETQFFVERLARSVHEGRGVEAASNFTRWLRFSGLLGVFDKFTVPGSSGVVNGEEMRKLVDDVVAACGQIFRGGKQPVNPSQSTIDQINAKVDFILSQMAKPTSSPTSGTARAGEPALFVTAGDASPSLALSCASEGRAGS
jgi:hypothetical protein